MKQEEAYTIIENVFSSSFDVSYSDIIDLCRRKIPDTDLLNKMLNLYEVVDRAAELFNGKNVSKAWLKEQGIRSYQDRSQFNMYYREKCTKQAQGGTSIG